MALVRTHFYISMIKYIQMREGSMCNLLFLDLSILQFQKDLNKARIFQYKAKHMRLNDLYRQPLGSMK